MEHLFFCPFFLLVDIASHYRGWKHKIVTSSASPAARSWAWEPIMANRQEGAPAEGLPNKTKQVIRAFFPAFWWTYVKMVFGAVASIFWPREGGEDIKEKTQFYEVAENKDLESSEFLSCEILMSFYFLISPNRNTLLMTERISNRLSVQTHSIFCI